MDRDKDVDVYRSTVIVIPEEEQLLGALHLCTTATALLVGGIYYLARIFRPRRFRWGQPTLPK